MSSVNGINSLAFQQAIQGAVFIASKVSIAKDAAGAYNGDIVESVARIEKIFLDMGHPTRETVKKIEESGIKLYIEKVGTLIDTFLSPDQFTYPRQYLSKKEILKSLERGEQKEIQYYANPGIYEKRTYKFLLHVFDTGKFINKIYGLVGDNGQFGKIFPAYDEAHSKLNSLIQVHENLLNILRSKNSFFDKDLIEGLMSFDRAYFSCIDLERKCFSSSNRAKELARILFNIREKEVVEYVHFLTGLDADIKKGSETLPIWTRMKFFAVLNNEQTITAKETAKEASHHSDEKAKRLAYLTSLALRDTDIDQVIITEDIKPEVFEACFWESLRQLPSKQSEESYQFILKSLSESLASIFKILPPKAVEEREYWVLQYSFARTFKNIFFQNAESLKHFNNRRTETLFDLTQGQLESFIKALRELKGEEKDYLLSKIESIRPDFKENKSFSLNKKSDIDNLYSTLIGLTTVFLQNLCKENDSFLPNFFSNLENQKKSG